jgi:hypothetical protein
VYELPEGAQEDSVEAIYTVLNALPADSPNRAEIEAAFEDTKRDIGVDEFGRPYYDAASQTSTRYNAPPLPEDLPDWMQEGLIREGAVLGDDYTEQALSERHRGAGALAPFADPRFARLPSGQLYLDYGQTAEGAPGPVFANQGRIYGSEQEAADAEYAYGRALSSPSNEVLRQQAREAAMIQDMNAFVNEKGLIDIGPATARASDEQEIDKPRRFAGGGSMFADRPKFITDATSGRVEGIFGEAGGETATFDPVRGQPPEGFSAGYRPDLYERSNYFSQWEPPLWTVLPPEPTYFMQGQGVNRGAVSNITPELRKRRLEDWTMNSHERFLAGEKALAERRKEMAAWRNPQPAAPAVDEVLPSRRRMQLATIGAGY